MNKKILYYLASLTLTTVLFEKVLFAQSVVNNSNRTVTGLYVSQSIQIDGFLSEPAWQLRAGYSTVTGAFPANQRLLNQINTNDNGTTGVPPVGPPLVSYNTQASFGIIWDTSYVYAAFVVTDPNLTVPGLSTSLGLNNLAGGELFFSMGNLRSAHSTLNNNWPRAYNTQNPNGEITDFQVQFRFNNPSDNSVLITNPAGNTNPANIIAYKTRTPTGYIIEIRINWYELDQALTDPFDRTRYVDPSQKARDGRVIGLDVSNLIYNPTVTTATSANMPQLMWSQCCFNRNWTETQNFGTLILGGSPITVSGVTLSAGSNVITSSGASTQISATVTPSNATDKTISWSVLPANGAAITPFGVFSAISNGIITVIGTSNNNPSAKGFTIITVTGQPAVPVLSMTVNGANITTKNGSSTMSVSYNPSVPTNNAVLWSVDNTLIATISGAGLLRAITNGVVLVRATSVSNPSVSATRLITITGQGGSGAGISKSVGYQVIDGFGGFGGRVAPWEGTAYNAGWLNTVVNDLGATIVRFELPPTFETINDNNDPFSINFSGFDLTNAIGATGTTAGGCINPSCTPVSVPGQGMLTYAIPAGTGASCNNTGQFTITDWFNYARDLSISTLANTGDTMKIIATVWSPPSWMKYQNCAFGTDYYWNRLIASDFLPSLGDPQNAWNLPATGPNSGAFPLDRKDEFAEMCEAYIRLMRQNTIQGTFPGVNLYALSIQNELDFAQPYQSCVYSVNQYNALIKVVGRRLRQAGLKTKLFGTEDIGNPQRYQQFLSKMALDDSSRKYFDIAAIHAYNSTGTLAGSSDANLWSSMYTSANLGRQRPFWQTETSGYGIGMAGAMNMNNAIYIALKYGKVSAWVYWTLGAATALETNDPDGYSLVYNGGSVYTKRYNALKQYARFIRPGAVMVDIQTTDPNVLALAFQHNTKQTMTVVLTNTSATPTTILGLNLANAPGTPTTFTRYLTDATNDCANLGSINVSNGNPIPLPANSITTLYGTGSTPATFPVTSIQVVPAINSNSITVVGGTLQMQTIILPQSASNKAVNWSLVPGGIATINTNGLLTAVSNGSVTVRATSVSNPTVSGTFVVNISNQTVSIPVTSATISGVSNTNIITAAGGSITMQGTYSPSNANLNTLIGWSANISGGIATFNSTNGILTALNNGNGVVTITGSYGAVQAIRLVTISGQYVPIPVVTATISGVGGVNQITTPGGSLSMVGVYSPANANINTLVGWTATIPGGIATFNATLGTLTATNNGNGIVSITGSYGAVRVLQFVTISGQYVAIPVTSVTVTITSAPVISIAGATLQLGAFITPSNANVNTVAGWSILDPSGQNSINPTTGLLQANTNGNAVVTVVSTFGTVSGIRVVTITNQLIPVTSATITSTSGLTITLAGGTLQMVATYAPANANTNTLIGWSIIDPSSQNNINPSTGLLQSNTNGNAVVTVVGTYGGGVIARRTITISGQNIPVVSATVSGLGGQTSITIAGGFLTLSGSYFPANANTNTLVGWSITDPSGNASFNAGTGILRAIKNGTVTITGTYGSVTASRIITLTNQATAISITGLGGTSIINTNLGSLQMLAWYTPLGSSVTGTSWNVVGGAATISGTGMLQALFDGTVTVVGTSVLNPSLSFVLPIVISNQAASIISVTGLTLTGVNTISVVAGTLNIGSIIAPVNASNPNITWSINPPSGVVNATSFATSVVLTATGNGVVTVTGVSSNPAVFARKVVTVSGYPIPVTSGTIVGASLISTPAGTINFTAVYAPTNANQNTLIGWNAFSNSFASFNTSGVLTALNNGNGVVTVTGTYGSVQLSKVVTILGQNVIVTSATISGTGGINQITTPSGSLIMQGFYSPSNANTNTLVGWSAIIPGSIATFNALSGTLTALNNGNGLVTISGTYGSVSATRIITISGQFTGIPVTSATITGTGGVTSITTAGGSLTMQGFYTPSNANTNTLVGWSAAIPGSIATFNNTSGVLTASNNGNGFVTITGTYGSVVTQTIIQISNQYVPVPVTSATISGVGGVNVISTAGGSLNLLATYSPLNANTNTLVGWSAIIPNGIASFNNVTGVLTALNNGNGVVTVTGTFGLISTSREIVLSNQYVPIPVTAATVSGANSLNVITLASGVLQMVSSYAPANANINTVIGWTINDPMGLVSFNAINGLITAQNYKNGTVTVTGTYGGGVSASRIIQITGQYEPVAGITIDGAGGVKTISVLGGTLQINRVFTPANPSSTNVVWSLNSGIASIDNNGLLTAIADGVIEVTATATNPDNSSFTQTILITISGQVVPVTGITIFGVGSASTIATDKGTLQLDKTLVPANTTQLQVLWSSSDTSIAQIDVLTGLVSARGNGVVTITAVAQFNSSVRANFVLPVSGQIKPIEAIEFDLLSSSILPDSVPLVVRLYPSYTTQTELKWTVQPSGMGSVNSGAVFFPTNYGVVTVTAKAMADTSITYSKTVVYGIRSLFGITVRKASDTASTKIGSNVQIIALMAPRNSIFHDVEWQVAPASVATISQSGLLQVLGNGVVTITATSLDKFGVSGSMMLGVGGASITAVYNPSETSGYSVYPNPASSWFEVRTPTDDHKVIEITNLQGTIIETKSASSKVVRFNSRNFTKGLYIIQIKSASETQSIKLMIE